MNISGTSPLLHVCRRLYARYCKGWNPIQHLAIHLCKLRASAHPIPLAAPVQVPCHVPCHTFAVDVLLPEVLDPRETID